MVKWRFHLILLSCFVVTFLPGQTLAVESEKIGVVDIAKVVTPFMETIQQQVEKLLHDYHTEFAEIEKALRRENNEIVDAQKAIGETDEVQKKAWSQRKEAFEKRVGQVRHDADEKKQRLGTAHETVVRRLQDKVLEVIQQVGEEQNLSIIVPQQGLVYWKKTLDITEAVQKALNAQIQGISLVVVTELNNA